MSSEPRLDPCQALDLARRPMTLLSELQSLLGPSHVLTGADADGYV